MPKGIRSALHPNTGTAQLHLGEHFYFSTSNGNFYHLIQSQKCKLRNTQLALEHYRIRDPKVQLFFQHALKKLPNTRQIHQVVTRVLSSETSLWEEKGSLDAFSRLKLEKVQIAPSTREDIKKIAPNLKQGLYRWLRCHILIQWGRRGQHLPFFTVSSHFLPRIFSVTPH